MEGEDGRSRSRNEERRTESGGGIGGECLVGGGFKLEAATLIVFFGKLVRGVGIGYNVSEKEGKKEERFESYCFLSACEWLRRS